MANYLTTPPEVARRGWASRLFTSLTARGRGAAEASPAATRQTAAKVHGVARQLIAEGRCAFVLLREAVDNISEPEAALAWNALDDQMATIPYGVAPVVHSNGGVGPVAVPAFHLDRRAVSNRQYQAFVDSGGYDNLEIWPKEVWPSVMKLVDRTRRPGPREWENGQFPVAVADHPVVGVSWYEAAAYAAWVGRRLPTAAEWQKAGGWPEHLSGGSCHRFPWGDVFEPARANLASSGKGKTVPVGDYANGSTPNGIYQMTGNVWEWLADRLETIPCRPDETFQVLRPMRRIVGGAYDTYFTAEATSQFITGQADLDRRDNIGFRCALSVSRLRPRT